MKRSKRRNTGFALRLAALIFAAIVLASSLILIILARAGVFDRPKPLQDGFIQETVKEQDHYEALGYDLELQSVGRFSGLYVEDGSLETVGDILMVQIKNNGDHDLRLARLTLTYSDGDAEFEITNLPAGKSVYVLEKNRRTYSDERHLSVEMADVVKFKDNMDVFPDRYEITGLDGALNVKNISTTDISGDLYVYYKYFSQDQLYGGITFRAKIPGGVKAGEIRQISAGHFNPDNCIVLAVTTEG